jgi:curved DNA-binding protein CbpA
MEHHPDRHDGCSNKEAQFKQINEAYSVLIDAARKRQYDREIAQAFGRTSFSQRQRQQQHSKVYAPSPPPEWKGGVWNHRTHYDMHYGDGFQREAFRRMRESAQNEGAFQYESPLGRGFTFDANSDNASEQVNPYSKAKQGPPKIVMEYEEIDRDMVSGKEHVRKRERIVEDMYQRRQERYNSSDSRQEQQGQQQQRHQQQSNQQQQQYSQSNAAFVRRQQNDCIIL